MIHGYPVFLLSPICQGDLLLL